MPTSGKPQSSYGSTGTTGCPTEAEILSALSPAGSTAIVERVHHHLDECPRCRVTAAAAVSARLLAGEGSTTIARGRSLTDGEIVASRYRVVRLIGRGGMGEVYEAEDELLGGAVALKTLSVDLLTDPRALARLKREIRLAWRISSPNVCRIREFGLHSTAQGNATPFLTMELMAGETLAELIARTGRLDEETVGDIAHQVLTGLEAIHDAGVVHRDLKPENIFLIRAEGTPRVRVVVMDFGLAYATDRAGDLSWSTGASIVGTPHYMAPEQIQGKPPGPPADIYAFGVLLFRLLTGRMPFTGETPMEVATRRLYERAPAVSSVVAVSPRWEQIVARTLEIDPQARFATVRDIRMLVETSRVERPASVRGRRLWLGGAVLAVALIVAGTIGWGFRTRPAPPPATAAAAPPRVVPSPSPEPARPTPPSNPAPAIALPAAPGPPAAKSGRARRPRPMAAVKERAPPIPQATPAPAVERPRADEDIAQPEFEKRSHPPDSSDLAVPFAR